MIYSISQGNWCPKIVAELILDTAHQINQSNKYLKNPNNITYYLRCSELKDCVYM